MDLVTLLQGPAEGRQCSGSCIWVQKITDKSRGQTIEGFKSGVKSLKCSKSIQSAVTLTLSTVFSYPNILTEDNLQ